MLNIIDIIHAAQQHPDNIQSHIQDAVKMLSTLRHDWWEDLMFPAITGGHDVVVTRPELHEGHLMVSLLDESGTLKKRIDIARKPELLIPLLENLNGAVDAMLIREIDEGQRREHAGWVQEEINKADRRHSNR